MSMNKTAKIFFANIKSRETDNGRNKSLSEAHTLKFYPLHKAKLAVLLSITQFNQFTFIKAERQLRHWSCRSAEDWFLPVFLFIKTEDRFFYLHQITFFYSHGNDEAGDKDEVEKSGEVVLRCWSWKVKRTSWKIEV